ncbi:MAG: BrnA antitoxin family protein, partial [Clostridiales Family XIII bacterium]|nr:BrnA antitoxin family protein [Clostridiales Family XIII bacterium]
KRQITINLDSDTIEFFKAQSEESGIPYQTLINLYLSDCATKNKQFRMEWD